jgi:hypothetical protein
MLSLAYLCFYDAAEKLGEVWKLQLESAKDPLLDSVDVLESNWRLARDVLQRTRHVLTRMFAGLFPRKKDELPPAISGRWSKPLIPSKTLFLP